MTLKCFKSGIQIGYLITFNSMDDPLSNILYDLLFDIIIFFIWLIYPIYLCNIKERKIINNNFNFNKLILISLFNYILSGFISSLYYNYLI